MTAPRHGRPKDLYRFRGITRDSKGKRRYRLQNLTTGKEVDLQPYRFKRLKTEGRVRFC